MLSQLQNALQAASDKKRSADLQQYFKTGKGEYGEGDIFLGITVPVLRGIAKQFLGLSLREAKTLLKSKLHEERLVALMILVYQYEKAAPDVKEEIFSF